MLSPFEQAVSNAFVTLQTTAGIVATYRRSPGNPGSSSGSSGGAVMLTVIPSFSKVALENDVGVVVNVRVQDFLIAAADLQFDGLLTQPVSGDQIEIQRLDGLQVYQVMGPGGGEPDWRYSDTGRTRLRVHTKFLETIE